MYLKAALCTRFDKARASFAELNSALFRLPPRYRHAQRQDRKPALLVAGGAPLGHCWPEEHERAAGVFRCG